MDDRQETVAVTRRAAAGTHRRARPSGDAEDGATRVRSAGAGAIEPTVILPLPPIARLATIASALPVGFRLHEYRVDSVLGQGGFGITYLATDINLHAAVAIKEFLPVKLAVRIADSTVRPRCDGHEPLLREGLERFLTEARTLATFRHPNIVRVARLFEANRTAYMVLDYERGRSLGDWWRSRRHETLGLPRRGCGRQGDAAAGRALAPPVPEPDLALLLSPLLDGLALVHRSGVLHRDIKPDNLYVRDEDGSLVLLDFGAARPTTLAVFDTLSMLTPGFAPIEQHQGGHQGPWTDLYAFGATLYWMVAGRRLREAPDRLADPLGELNAEQAGAGRYSRAFLQAIDWALQIDPEDRPQSVEDFRRAIFAAHATSLGLREALAASIEEATADAPTGAAAARARRQWHCRIGRRILHPGSWPIEAKMALALALLAVLPLSVTGYHSYVSSVAALSSAERRSLEHLALITAGRIPPLLDDGRRVSAFLPNDREVAGLLVRSSEDTREALGTPFAGLVAANSHVHLLTLMDGNGTGWVVGVTETRQSFEAPLRQMLHRVLAGLFAVGLVSVVLALLFAHSIVRPIRQLTAAADALRRGDYESARVRLVSQDEVGTLGRTFNAMIDVLRQRERERSLRTPDEAKGHE